MKRAGSRKHKAEIFKRCDAPVASGKDYELREGTAPKAEGCGGVNFNKNIAKSETNRFHKDMYYVLYARIYEYALTQLEAPLCVYGLPDGQRLLEISREASKRIIWCSIVYKVSGDRRFANRAIEEMINVCAFPDWHPDHYLDVVQMTYGVGLGYDWLYNELTSSQRATIAKAVYNYAMVSCEGESFWKTKSNWNVWCHGGLTIGALAIYESYPAVCRSYLSRAISSIQISLNEYAPLGAFPEGPGYYGVVSEFTSLFMDSMLYSNANESVASFRSFSGDPRQIYAAIKSGYNNTSHSDMDIGTFVMEAMRAPTMVAMRRSMCWMLMTATV